MAETAGQLPETKARPSQLVHVPCARPETAGLPPEATVANYPEAPAETACESEIEGACK